MDASVALAVFEARLQTTYVLNMVYWYECCTPAAAPPVICKVVYAGKASRGRARLTAHNKNFALFTFNQLMLAGLNDGAFQGIAGHPRPSLHLSADLGNHDACIIQQCRARELRVYTSAINAQSDVRMRETERFLIGKSHTHCHAHWHWCCCPCPCSCLDVHVCVCDVCVLRMLVCVR